MIQKTAFQMFQIVFHLTEKLVPILAGKWAVKLFFTPRKFNRPKWESNLLENADRKKVQFKSNFKFGKHEDYYIRYDWDNTGPVILLVHGWEGRGSQMGHFVKPLLDAGYRIISFDAIAHGDSPGKRTSMPEFAQIIEDISKEVGGFYAIIGHSLGGTAAGYAVAGSVHANNLITICSPATIEFIFESFAQQIQASKKTMRRLSKFLEDFTGKKAEDSSFTNIATQIDIPGLIIHDQNDKEIPYSEGLALHKNWMSSEIILTERLGHRRILKDVKTISRIMNFLEIQHQEKLSYKAASI